ncbi:YwiC-like family protein [Deinococcus ficus]|uniref:YwiC-like protein n=1 Tax=Deinococcus ficus TaxID=317577 RepID=A0A221SSS8_9DEIO|nr:YwiC-like family protein [Deinococcus ficus]ASN79691.1 hypothetical protein DFI_00580 [Deinococcus ficus]
MTTPANPTTPARPRPKAARKPGRRRVGAEWMPRQHGAWAMLFLPYLVGVTLLAQGSGVPAFAWPLLPAWLFGYFAFNALTLWLKSGRKPLYLRPALTYGAVSGVLGGLTLALAPHLLGWALAFAPLLGVGLWRAAHRDDASLLARGSAVVAACLLTAVMTTGGPLDALRLPLTARPTLATLALWAYFLGTLLYVKTMIRERGEAAYLTLSVGAHAALFALALWGALTGVVPAAFPAFFLLTTVRAAVMPRLEGWRGRRVTPKQVGLTEFGISFLLLFLLGWA